MLKVFLVALGGAIGSVFRYGLITLIRYFWACSFPWGTLTVNVVGSFIIGFVIQSTHKMTFEMKIFIIVGVLGGFTTFSSFTADMMYLLEVKKIYYAALYLFGSFVLSMLMYCAGAYLARYFF